MANTEDLRYVRTETAIRTAFMELASESPVAQITATALCHRANISRNAFYLHHASVTQLYATLIDEFIADVRAESMSSVKRSVAAGSDEEFDALIIKSIARHEDFLRALIPTDDGSLSKRLAEGVEECFVEAARRFGEHGASFEHRLRCSFSACGLMGLVIRWITTTNRPLIEMTPSFVELHAPVRDVAASYLLR